MAKYIRKTLRCGCCGSTFEAKILAGFYQGAAAGLDTNPHQPEVFDLYIICPNCGYSSSNITKADPKTITYVFSSDYRRFIQTAQVDETIKRISGAAAISAQQGNYKTAGYANLVLSWYLREKGLSPSEALTKCIDFYSKYLSVAQDFDVAIIVVDCMRQMALFDEANETAESLMEYVQDVRLKAIITFERQLIAEKDSTPHLISEVPA